MIVFDPAFRFIQNGLDVLDVIAGVVVALVVEGTVLMTATEAAHHTDLFFRKGFFQFLFYHCLGAGAHASGTVADIDLLSLVLRAGKIIKGG